MYFDVSFGAHERILCQLKLEVRLASSCHVLVLYPNNPILLFYCYCVYAISSFVFARVRAGAEFWKLETYCSAEMAILMCILMFLFGAYERILCQLKLEVRLASSCHVLMLYPTNSLLLFYCRVVEARFAF